ncbi:MAG: secretin N-terminal domain-containing protein, partial [Pyrinomonadaceae bacterium]
MLSVRRRLFLALALTLCAAGAAMGQSEQPKPQDNFVTQKMFANRVFDIKNRDPVSLSRVLAPLTSGFRGAVVMPNPEFRTITVRDFPENIAVIEEAIRRLDTPE